MLYERRHTRLIADFGGLWAVMPVFSALFLVVMFSSIGLPGLNGFVGEFLILLGAFQVEPAGGGARPPPASSSRRCTCSGCTSAWCSARSRHEENRRLTDLNAREVWTLRPAAAPDRLDRRLPEAVHRRHRAGGGGPAPGVQDKRAAALAAVARGRRPSRAMTAGLPAARLAGALPGPDRDRGVLRVPPARRDARGAPGRASSPPSGCSGVVGAAGVSVAPLGRPGARASRACSSLDGVRAVLQRRHRRGRRPGAAAVGRVPPAPGRGGGRVLRAGPLRHGRHDAHGRGDDLLVVFLALELMSLVAVRARRLLPRPARRATRPR